jgi:hypothetical protein
MVTCDNAHIVSRAQIAFVSYNHKPLVFFFLLVKKNVVGRSVMLLALVSVINASWYHKPIL